MQIVVNTRLLLPNKLDGIGWFTFQTLKRITQQNPDTHFVFLFDRDYSEEFIFSDNITPLVISPQARHPVLYYAWFHHSVKSVLNSLKPDLFFSPDGFLSPGAKCKQLPVIHDINFYHNPKDLRFLTSKYYNYFFPKYASTAARIATVSEYSKLDISKHYHIPEQKIDVVYNGINEGYKVLSDSEKTAVKKQYSDGLPYFLFVGSISPRKNLLRLIKAFEKFKEQTNSNFKLLIAGAFLSDEYIIKKTIANSPYQNDIKILGRVPQSELEKIVASAFALTYVPYYEGFGIPIIEAMKCGVPVICSNVTSMPEIANDAALLTEPNNEEAIANNMLQIFENQNLYSDLSKKGIIRSDFFSWDKTAELMWNSITKCL
jgi:glycosyltransferase involved in cell wall biosynthesis